MAANAQATPTRAKSEKVAVSYEPSAWAYGIGL